MCFSFVHFKVISVVYISGSSSGDWGVNNLIIATVSTKFVHVFSIYNRLVVALVTLYHICTHTLCNNSVCTCTISWIWRGLGHTNGIILVPFQTMEGLVHFHSPGPFEISIQFSNVWALIYWHVCCLFEKLANAWTWEWGLPGKILK